ncbi:MAG TPA: thiamine diphosphokinase [Acidimicrobiia bacterium]|nr:thiamine diphosphokinase [Acidimicrobiia bacterium]
MGTVALVFTGGSAPTARALSGLPVPDIVIAADSGLHHAAAAGYRVDVVVGDLDSADPVAVEAAVAAGASIERHPTAKDATDLELALFAARDRECTRALLIGGAGGRLDHFLANVLVLASPDLSGLEIEARLAGARVVVVRDDCTLHAAVGHLCTLLPVGGPAIGVRTEGLEFPLRRETLWAGSTRGVSNTFLGDTARVTLDDGALLVVLPDELEVAS